MAFTIRQRAKCACWFDHSVSVVMVQRKFHAEFGKNPSESHGAGIRKLHAPLMETGSVADIKRNCQKPWSSGTISENVETHFAENPHSSLRSAATVVGICHESVRKVLKAGKWHPYKMQTVQKLYEDDYSCR